MSQSWTNILGKGVRQSYRIDLSPVKELSGSRIEWVSTEPTGTNLIIETSVDGGSTWDTATNGEPIPNLPDDLDGVTLDIRQRLETNDSTVTPRLDYLKARVNTIKYNIHNSSGISGAYNDGYLITEFESIKKSIGAGLFSPHLDDIHTNIPVASGRSNSEFTPSIFVLNNHQASGVSESELKSLVINIVKHQASGIANGEVEPLLIVFNEHQASGLAESIHDSRVFYVWNGKHQASGVSGAIVDGTTFHVHYGKHEASGVAVAEMDGAIVGRLLFRGKQMSR